MVDWNRRVANVAVRRLDARERAAYGLPDDVRPGCVVSLIFDRGTVACVIARFGAYWCPPLHDEYGPPLKKNATIDARGVLKLDAPLKGTYPTPPLAWQRYPHVDGYIEPWAAAGKLRPGLSLQGEDHGRCFSGTDETLLKSAISCVTPTLARSDPCFPQRRDWRRGDLAACADGPGYTTFRRWRIAGRAR